MVAGIGVISIQTKGDKCRRAQKLIKKYICGSAVLPNSKRQREMDEEWLRSWGSRKEFENRYHSIWKKSIAKL